MTDKRIRAVNENGNPVAGKVLLVYTDALASGTIEYVPVTYIALEDDNGQVHQVRPRDILEIVK